MQTPLQFEVEGALNTGQIVEATGEAVHASSRPYVQSMMVLAPAGDFSNVPVGPGGPIAPPPRTPVTLAETRGALARVQTSIQGGRNPTLFAAALQTLVVGVSDVAAHLASLAAFLRDTVPYSLDSGDAAVVLKVLRMLDEALQFPAATQTVPVETSTFTLPSAAQGVPLLLLLVGDASGACSVTVQAPAAASPPPLHVFAPTGAAPGAVSVTLQGSPVPPRAVTVVSAARCCTVTTSGGVDGGSLCVVTHGPGSASVSTKDVANAAVTAAATGDGDADVVCASANGDTQDCTVRATTHGMGSASVNCSVSGGNAAQGIVLSSVGCAVQAEALGSGDAEVACRNCDGPNNPGFPATVRASTASGASSVAAFTVKSGAAVTAESVDGPASTTVRKVNGGTVDVTSVSGTAAGKITKIQNNANGVFNVCSGGDASMEVKDGLRGGGILVQSTAGRADVLVKDGIISNKNVTLTVDAAAGAELDVRGRIRGNRAKLNVSVHTVDNAATILAPVIEATGTKAYSVEASSVNGTPTVCTTSGAAVSFVTPAPSVCP